MLPVTAGTLVQSVWCWVPSADNCHNQTSVSLILGTLTPISSLGTGVDTLKFYAESDPCLNWTKKPVLALLLPWLSFLNRMPNWLAGFGGAS